MVLIRTEDFYKSIAVVSGELYDYTDMTPYNSIINNSMTFQTINTINPELLLEKDLYFFRLLSISGINELRGEYTTLYNAFYYYITRVNDHTLNFDNFSMDEKVSSETILNNIITCMEDQLQVVCNQTGNKYTLIDIDKNFLFSREIASTFNNGDYFQCKNIICRELDEINLIDAIIYQTERIEADICYKYPNFYNNWVILTLDTSLSGDMFMMTTNIRTKIDSMITNMTVDEIKISSGIKVNIPV